MLAHQVSKLYNPARRLALVRGATDLGLNALLVSLLILACGRAARRATTGSHPLLSPSLRYHPGASYRLNTSIVKTYALFSRNANGNWQQALRLCFLLCALLMLILLLKEEAACILAHVLTCGACCACPCPTAGRAPLMLALCVLSSVSHLNL